MKFHRCKATSIKGEEVVHKVCKVPTKFHMRLMVANKFKEEICPTMSCITFWIFVIPCASIYKSYRDYMIMRKLLNFHHTCFYKYSVLTGSVTKRNKRVSCSAYCNTHKFCSSQSEGTIHWILYGHDLWTCELQHSFMEMTLVYGCWLNTP